MEILIATKHGLPTINAFFVRSSNYQYIAICPKCQHKIYGKGDRNKPIPQTHQTVCLYCEQVMDVVVK